MPDNGWVKIHRKLLEWEWYHDINTTHLFIHLLLICNHEPKKWKGIEVKAGQCVTGRKSLAKQTGLSEMQIRLCLQKLTTSQNLTIKTTNKFSIVSICNWDSYQGKTTSNLSNEQPTNNQQTTTNKNVRMKEVKNIALGKPKPLRKQSVREREIFKKGDYNLVLIAYQKLKGVELQGREFLPIQQAIKTMFLSSRSPYEIIALMEVFARGSQEWMENWTINTVKMKLPEFVAELKNRGQHEGRIAEVGRRWKVDEHR